MSNPGVRKGRPRHSGDICTQCDLFYILGYLGACNDQNGPIVLPSYPLNHINVK